MLQLVFWRPLSPRVADQMLVHFFVCPVPSHSLSCAASTARTLPWYVHGQALRGACCPTIPDLLQLFPFGSSHGCGASPTLGCPLSFPPRRCRRLCRLESRADQTFLGLGFLAWKLDPSPPQRPVHLDLHGLHDHATLSEVVQSLGAPHLHLFYDSVHWRTRLCQCEHCTDRSAHRGVKHDGR